MLYSQVGITNVYREYSEWIPDCLIKNKTSLKHTMHFDITNFDITNFDITYTIVIVFLMNFYAKKDFLVKRKVMFGHAKTYFPFEKCNVDVSCILSKNVFISIFLRNLCSGHVVMYFYYLTYW